MALLLPMHVRRLPVWAPALLWPGIHRHAVRRHDDQGGVRAGAERLPLRCHMRGLAHHLLRTVRSAHPLSRREGQPQPMVCDPRALAKNRMF
eukprot:3239232-Prymnesium_polylepis.1